MGARKIEKFPVQELALRAVKVDHDLQSRVATSMEYQREFSEAMLRGDVFPPVAVFFDGKTYWLADGFHRYGATKAIGKPSVRAEVREGGRRDAMIFSAGANQKFSIPRTKEDIRKAVHMMLSDPKWFSSGDQTIGKHVGCSGKQVQSIRLQYCAENNLGLPVLVEKSNGRKVRYRLEKNRLPSISRRASYCNKRGQMADRVTHFYESQIDGRCISLGSDESEAVKRLESLVDQRKARRSLLTTEGTRGLIENAKIACEGSQERFGAQYRWARALIDPDRGWVLTASENQPDVFVAAVGRLLLFQEAICPSAKMYVVCFPDQILDELSLAASAIGITLVAPEELVASLKEGKG